MKTKDEMEVNDENTSASNDSQIKQESDDKDQAMRVPDQKFGTPEHKRLKLKNQVDCKVSIGSSHLRNVFNCVPNEVWLKILGYLNTVEVSKAGAVCSKFFALTRDQSLWVKLQFDIKHVNTNVRALKRVIDRAVSVKEITITNSEKKDFDSMTVVSLAVRARKTLKKLVLCSEIKLKNEAMIMFGCLAELEVLHFNFDKIALTGLNAISKLKSLKEIRNLMSLIELRFMKWNEASWRRKISHFFKEMKNLVVLDFSGIPISKDTFRTLALNNPSLETVILPFSLMCSEASGLSLVDLTKNCPNLKHLNIRYGQEMNADNVDALAFSKKLVRLELAWCNELTDNMLVNIAKNCPQLRYLVLKDCDKVEDDGIRALAENCHNLEYLDIEDCESVNEDAVEELVKTCEKVRKIIWMHATPTFKKRMRETYPDLVFKCSEGTG